MLSVIFNTLLLLYSTLIGNESCLQNIQQLTFPEMGLEKAGEAYFRRGDQMISFQGVPSGEEDYQIYTLDLNSRVLNKITDAGACTCSYFRPDGEKIIYAASPYNSKKAPPGVYKWDFTPYMNIYEANIDGSDAKPLTYGPHYHAECAYSPDGKEIVYASDEDGSMNIYVMNSDGTDVRQLTHTNHCYNGGPFFSPDGQKIIFRADRDKPHFLQIYSIDVTGENEKKLTDDDAVNWAPYWHPSGKGIIYTTSLHGHHNYQVYFLNIENGKKYQVTSYPGFNGLPVFNREGNKLLWTSKRGPDKTSQIFIADINIPKEWIN